MEIILLLVLAYGIKRAWEDTGKAWRKSKAAYTAKARKRFPGAPKSKRAATALRHDIGWWASQLAGGFPATRHGFAAGWHQARTAQVSARTAREEARTVRLENQAAHAEHLSGFRERQQEAVRRWREAMDADRDRTTEGTVPGARPAPGWRSAEDGTLPADVDDVAGGEEGREGSGEGSPTAGHVRTETDPVTGEPADVITVDPPAGGEPGGDGRTYSWGPAASPYGWPAREDADKAHYYARRTSTDGSPQVVTEYPPGGGPGTTTATYAGGEEIQPSAEQVTAWQAEAEETRRKHSGWSAGPEDNPDPAQPERPAATEGTPTQGEQHMASDITYDSVIANMTAEKASADQRAAEQQQAAARASAMADQMQALEVDPVTLSAMADHLDAQDAASKALQRVQETAQAVSETLARGHAGLAEAHQSAPVQAANRTFYEG